MELVNIGYYQHTNDNWCLTFSRHTPNANFHHSRWRLGLTHTLLDPELSRRNNLTLPTVAFI